MRPTRKEFLKLPHAQQRNLLIAKKPDGNHFTVAEIIELRQVRKAKRRANANSPGKPKSV